MEAVDTAILTAAISAGSTVAVAITAIIANAKAYAGLKDQISLLERTFNQRFSDFEKVMDAKLARLEEMMLGKFAELDNRISALERHIEERS